MALIKGKKSKGGGKFKYKPLTSEYLETRKSGGGDYDQYVVEGIKMFKPQDGDNEIRIFPATWEDGEYAYDINMHYGIGPDRQSYLCAHAMKREPCPICDERKQADKDGDEEYSKSLKPNLRAAVWLIDRSKEGDGPKLWFMPKTLEREIPPQATDKKTGEVLQFIDPDEGYDLTFTKTGKEILTKYTGAKFARKPSALSDDEDTQEEWMQYVIDHPIPEILVFHDADRIAEAFGTSAGGGKGKSKPSKKGKEKEEEKDEEEEQLSWEEIHALSEKKLRKLAEEHDVDEDGLDEEELADAICEELGIEPPKKASKKKGKDVDEDEDADEDEDGDEDDELPSWKEVHKMDDDELSELAEKHDIDMDREFEDLEEAADYLCEEVGIDNPNDKKKKASKDDDDDDDDAPAKSKLGSKLSSLKKKSKK